MSILLFFLVLFVLILVHEWGHFIVAKKTGMRVDEFGIGFPPKILSIRKGETEYTFNLLPIGGFVRIWGENGMEETSAASDPSRAFSARPKWAQAAVLVAGVTMNILFAWFLFVIVFLMGVPTSVNESEAGEAARLTITEVLPESPAAQAQVSVGAEVIALSASGSVLEDNTPSAFSAFVQQHSNETLTLTYTTGNNNEKTVELVPQSGVLAANDTPAIGVAVSLIETTRQSFFEAVWSATTRTGAMLWAITVGITTLLAGVVTLTADFTGVTGPIGIAGLVGDAAQFGLTSLLVFTAIISLNLAVINMLPVPALDGGRLLFVAIEAIMRRPINPVWMARVNLIGFSLLILLMVAVTYSDILKLV